jgi:group I intron endonuclease
LITCIYKILNKITGKFYIGSAYNFNKRKWVHLCKLRKNYHDNKHLQAAWNKYGEANFEFIVLQECNKDELLKYEQIWLDWTKSFCREIGYNTCAIAGNSIGYKHTEEFRAWQANRLKGTKLSEETKAKMSKSASKPKTKEHAANIAKGKTGKSKWPIVVIGQPLTQKEDGSWL